MSAISAAVSLRQRPAEDGRDRGRRGGRLVGGGGGGGGLGIRLMRTAQGGGRLRVILARGSRRRRGLGIRLVRAAQSGGRLCVILAHRRRAGCSLGVGLSRCRGCRRRFRPFDDVGIVRQSDPLAGFGHRDRHRLEVTIDIDHDETVAICHFRGLPGRELRRLFCDCGHSALHEHFAGFRRDVFAALADEVFGPA
ncbi:MAG: hypothetical protein R3D59_18245 [Paracoccaceae bacterium]